MLKVERFRKGTWSLEPEVVVGIAGRIHHGFDSFATIVDPVETWIYVRQKT